MSCRERNFMIILLFITITLCLIQVDISKQIDPQSLIRIHVLANSNSDSDQALKLQVKDAIVAYLAPQLEQSQSLEESRSIIQSQIPQLTKIANETLALHNSSDAATLQYGHFAFPIKYYGNFSLPAGNYEALRILIGEAEGRNWWCVLFPPLCFTDNNVQSSGKYTDEMPQEKIVIKWRGKEWIDQWRK